MTTARLDSAPDLREHLLTRVLPFWADHGIDQESGGYITHLARDGSVTDARHKHLVTQTRMVYSFAAGVALGGPPEWANLARQGLDFLLRWFRDVEHDGWFWSVSRRGSPHETAKRTYGHAFATYALAEYARLLGDSRALASAIHTWSVILDRFWDPERGGVIEACDRGWEPTDRGHTMGTHLHTLEALLALGEATNTKVYWPHVRAVADLIARRMVEAQHRCGLERFLPDWEEDVASNRGLVNYGHNLEAAWLLLRVDEVENVATYRDTAKGFLDYVLRYGIDTTYGGVFSHGPLGAQASVRQKIWWVQTEALPAFLLAYLVFREARYWDAFRNVVGFCLRCLHDPEYGEWYHSTEEDGTPRETAKGSAWKAAYHVTQACWYVHRYLSRTAAKP